LQYLFIDCYASTGLLLSLYDQRVQLLGRVANHLLQITHKLVHEAFALHFAEKDETFR
jgi:hypothetical protein